MMLSPISSHERVRSLSGGTDRDEPLSPAPSSVPSSEDTAAVVSDRKQRDRDRKRRERRVQKTSLTHMRDQIAVLETAAAAIPTIDDADAAWDDFLDDDTKRMRSFLRKTLRLTQEAQRLLHERTALDRLLREHELWAAAMRTLGEDENDLQKNDWAANVTRWHALSRAYFTPWTLLQCQEEIDAALFEMHQFEWSSDTTSSGLQILGWQDQRRLDRDKSCVQFCFHKTFRGADLLRHTEHHWDAYTKQEVYRQIVVGGKAVVNLEVMQAITPDKCIIRLDEQYDGDHLFVHAIYLVFRIELERGFLMSARSISCPEIQQANNLKTDCWGSDFFWFRWELLDDKRTEEVDLSRTDYVQTIGGSVGADDLSYANRWLFEVLAAVVRGEMAATNNKYLQW